MASLGGELVSAYSRLFKVKCKYSGALFWLQGQKAPYHFRESLLAEVPTLVWPQREWVANGHRANMCFKLYGFYNMLDIEDILATENELRQVIEEHGPFDGLLGYS